MADAAAVPAASVEGHGHGEVSAGRRHREGSRGAREGFQKLHSRANLLPAFNKRCHPQHYLAVGGEYVVFHLPPIRYFSSDLHV